jgi:hypothetical protein
MKIDGTFGGTWAFHIGLCYGFYCLIRRNVAAGAPASYEVVDIAVKKVF